MADSDEQIVEVQEVEIEAIPVHIKEEIDSDSDNDGMGHTFDTNQRTDNTYTAIKTVITFGF